MEFEVGQLSAQQYEELCQVALALRKTVVRFVPPVDATEHARAAAPPDVDVANLGDLLIVRAPEGTTALARNEAFVTVQAASPRSAVVVLPHGWTIELVEARSPTDQEREEFHGRLQDLCAAGHVFVLPESYSEFGACNGCGVGLENPAASGWYRLEAQRPGVDADWLCPSCAKGEPSDGRGEIR